MSAASRPPSRRDWPAAIALTLLTLAAVVVMLAMLLSAAVRGPGAIAHPPPPVRYQAPPPAPLQCPCFTDPVSQAKRPPRVTPRRPR